MPNPINGQGQAQAATQVRIINLSPAIPTAITGDAVVAIDLPNETYKLTLDELVNFAGIDNYLPLAGGTMTGDITLSNSLSVNTVVENANTGNIGKTNISVVSDIDNISNTGFFKSNVGATGAPNSSDSFNVLHFADSNNVEYTRIAQAIGKNLLFHKSKTGAGSPTSWFQVASYDPSDPSSSGFLPLTGGILTGQSNVLRIRQPAASQSSYIGFLSEDGAQVGLVGQNDAGNDIALHALAGGANLDLKSGSGEVIITSEADDLRMKATQGSSIVDSLNLNLNATSDRNSDPSVARATIDMTSSAATGSEQVLRKMRGGSSDTVWWETVKSGSYGWKQGVSPDGDYLFQLGSQGAAFAKDDVVAFLGLPNEVKMSEVARFTTGGSGTAADPYYRYDAASKTMEYWGATGSVAGNGSATVTFATPAFASSTSYAVTANRVDDGQNNQDAPAITRVSATSCTLDNVNSDPMTISFHVIGITA